MKVLIVESESGLAAIWQKHLQRMGMFAEVCGAQDDAIEHLTHHAPDIIILDLLLDEGSAFAVADYASFRMPDTRVIFVTNTSFFSDGSIFAFAPNACAFVQRATPPDDLVAMVEHYGAEARSTQPDAV